jgi:diguanylate cyclase (GGDEF)-like protein
MSSARLDSDPFSVASAFADDSGALAGMEPVANAAAPSLSDALGGLLDGVARTLGVPIALLSRDRAGWRFEAEGFPPHPVADAPRFRSAATEWPAGSEAAITDQAGSPWTGLIAGQLRHREWLLMLPGNAERWNTVAGLEGVIGRFGQSLEAAVRDDDERQLGARHRRMYVFVRRLTRTSEVAQIHRCILLAMANEVNAETAAFAVFSESEQALTITATHGYPLSIVDHVRIARGEGIIGRTFATGRATIGRCDEAVRRLRYRTDSYMAVPLVASGRVVAVITLTDRADGRAFDGRDLAAIRLLAAPAALAVARQRVTESLDELTRAATVDPVTGLFNRRYFESRIQVEVERARRQQQDLALLMVDIDDFKRINDTFGHLEGDRALRDVADLLRRGVRIFDVCARYGGEEFAIVMPGATREMAVQVAERIRRGMHDRSRLTPLPMTVSIGVGFLGAESSEEDLIGAADRALIAAKRAGKNVVKAD